MLVEIVYQTYLFFFFFFEKNQTYLSYLSKSTLHHRRSVPGTHKATFFPEIEPIPSSSSRSSTKICPSVSRLAAASLSGMSVLKNPKVDLSEAIESLETSAASVSRDRQVLKSLGNKAKREILGYVIYYVTLYGIIILFAQGVSSSVIVLVVLIYMLGLINSAITVWRTINRMEMSFLRFEDGKKELNKELDYIIRWCQHRANGVYQYDYEMLIQHFNFRRKMFNRSATTLWCRLYLIAIVVLAFGYGMIMLYVFHVEGYPLGTLLPFQQLKPLPTT